MPYRLLKSSLPKESDQFKEAAFVVSVDRTLNEHEITTLLCEILAKEKPSDYQRLTIDVYVDLDEYIPALGSPILERKLKEHHLANYVWARDIRGHGRRLAVTRDSHGRPLNHWHFYDYDHTNDCRQ